MIAWRVRNNLGLDHLKGVAGVSGDPDRPDNIVYDISPSAQPSARSGSASTVSGTRRASTRLTRARFQRSHRLSVKDETRCYRSGVETLYSLHTRRGEVIGATSWVVNLIAGLLFLLFVEPAARIGKKPLVINMKLFE